MINYLFNHLMKFSSLLITFLLGLLVMQPHCTCQIKGKINGLICRLRSRRRRRFICSLRALQRFLSRDSRTKNKI